MKAIDIMTTRVATVSPDHSVRHAARIMLDNNVSGLPVMNDDGRLVGILTEGDLLRRSEIGTELVRISGRSREPARDYLRSHSWEVGDVMTRDLVAVDEGTAIGQIATIMEERGIKRLPVLREGALVGIVSRADLLRLIAVAKPEAPIKGDDALRRSVVARLDEVPELRDARLNVIVADGRVHLSGSVMSHAAREAARAIAEGVRGTVCVVDHVELAPDRASPASFAADGNDGPEAGR